MKKVLVGVIFLSTLAYSEEVTTASILLDKLTQNLDGLKSVIITTETIARGSKTPGMEKLGEKAFTYNEFRTDGNRTRECMKIWGAVLGYDLERKDAIHKSGLWDGESYYQYDYATHIADTPVPNGRVHFTPKTEIREFDNNSTITTREIIASSSGPILGYLPNDDNRIDHILRTCPNIKVEEEKVPIGGSLCFILGAETYTGSYKVYLDPERNYSIVKLQNIKAVGDKAFSYGYELQGKDKVSYTYEAKEFKNIDGQWVPSKYESIHKRIMHDGRIISPSKAEVSIKDVKLNPDHEAMNSFVPDDIRNGAYVTITGDKKNIYTWQDGQPVKRSEVKN
jgi:hypothetical protein